MTKAARFSLRDVSAIVAVGVTGVVSALTTFTNWTNIGTSTVSPADLYQRYPDPMTGWQLLIKVGLTFTAEQGVQASSGTAFTGWATILPGVLLIALTVLLACAINRNVYSSELPYPRWVVVTVRILGLATLLLLGLEAFLLLICGAGVAWALVLAWWMALVGLWWLVGPRDWLNVRWPSSFTSRGL